jgi:dTDP-4-amino-4,6-dideoxy-D-galactose acyltransferase
MSTKAITPLLLGRSSHELRDGIADAGVVSPHAFIRGLDAGYDRKVMLDQWLRPLAESDDLRFRFEHGDGTEHWVLMERLAWDSEFFGRGMARLNAVLRPGMSSPLRADVAPGIKAVHTTLEQVRTRGIDYVFCPVSPNDLPTIRTLSACGFDLIETRCHYHRPLVAPPPQRYSTRLATPADIPSLARAARITVNPFDRFHADPAVSEESAGKLMERWVEASITAGFADATIVPDVEAPEAFSTAKFHRELWQGWGW